MVAKHHKNVFTVLLMALVALFGFSPVSAAESSASVSVDNYIKIERENIVFDSQLSSYIFKSQEYEVTYLTIPNSINFVADVEGQGGQFGIGYYIMNDGQLESFIGGFDRFLTFEHLPSMSNIIPSYLSDRMKNEDGYLSDRAEVDSNINLSKQGKDYKLTDQEIYVVFWYTIANNEYMLHLFNFIEEDSEHAGPVLDSEPADEQGLIEVMVDGEPLVMDVSPTIEDGRTLVPLRAIFEALDATVDWDGDNETITGQKDDTLVVLELGDENATVNGETIVLDVPAKKIDNRTMVPTRFIAESLGAVVDWDDANQTVSISSAQ